MPEQSNNPFQFWQELKRRRVIRVIPVYAAAAFVILELVDIVAPSLGLPTWTLNFIIILLCIGFVISIILSWVYDITPEGVQKTKPSREILKKEKPITSNVWKVATYVSIVIIIGLLIVNIIGGRKNAKSQDNLEKSIAVLPFKNFSADPNQEYMCDGLTDEIINHLYKIKSFEKVVSLNSVLTYKETIKRIPEIAVELGVNYILEGTYKKIGDQVRVTAQLIEPINDKHIWQNEYDQPFAEIITIQSNIAEQIANELKTVLSTEELLQIEKRITDNPEAFDLYFKGRYFWNKRTEEGVKEAIGYFNNAIDVDTNFARAYAGLADCYNLIGNYEYITSKDGIWDNYQNGIDAATKALKIDSSLAEAYTSLAYVKLYHNWDWRGALKDFERAIQLNPSYSPAHQWYANCFTVYTQHDKAITEAKLAQELDPLSPIINRNVGFRLYLARKYDQAIEELLHALFLSPDFYVTHYTLGLAYLQKSMVPEAISEMQKALRYSRDNSYCNSLLGYVYGTTGDQDKAQFILNELIEISKERHVSPISFAIIYIGLGESKNAIIWLEKAYENRTSNLIYLNTDPIYDPLRSDPRFVEIVKKMGFEK